MFSFLGPASRLRFVYHRVSLCLGSILGRIMYSRPSVQKPGTKEQFIYTEGREGAYVHSGLSLPKSFFHICARATAQNFFSSHPPLDFNQPKGATCGTAPAAGLLAWEIIYICTKASFVSSLNRQKVADCMALFALITWRFSLVSLCGLNLLDFPSVVAGGNKNGLERVCPVSAQVRTGSWGAS